MTRRNQIIVAIVVVVVVIILAWALWPAADVPVEPAAGGEAEETTTQ